MLARTDTRAPFPVCAQIFSDAESDQWSEGDEGGSDGELSEDEREVSGRLNCRARPVMGASARSARAPGCRRIGGMCAHPSTLRHIAHICNGACVRVFASLSVCARN